MVRQPLLTLLFLTVTLFFAGCANREVLTGDGLVVLEGVTLLRPDGALQPGAVLVLYQDPRR